MLAQGAHQSLFFLSPAVRCHSTAEAEVCQLQDAKTEITSLARKVFLSCSSSCGWVQMQWDCVSPNTVLCPVLMGVQALELPGACGGTRMCGGAVCCGQGAMQWFGMLLLQSVWHVWGQTSPLWEKETGNCLESGFSINSRTVFEVALSTLSTLDCRAHLFPYGFVKSSLYCSYCGLHEFCPSLLFCLLPASLNPLSSDFILE